jgi:hypothetical protein
MCRPYNVHHHLAMEIKASCSIFYSTSFFLSRVTVYRYRYDFGLEIPVADDNSAFAHRDGWMKVVSLGRSFLQGEARRFLGKSARRSPERVLKCIFRIMYELVGRIHR